MVSDPIILIFKIPGEFQALMYRFRVHYKAWSGKKLLQVRQLPHQILVVELRATLDLFDALKACINKVYMLYLVQLIVHSKSPSRGISEVSETQWSSKIDIYSNRTATLIEHSP